MLVFFGEAWHCRNVATTITTCFAQGIEYEAYHCDRLFQCLDYNVCHHR